MTEDELLNEATDLKGWQRHKFMLLVGLTIVTSLILVVIALELYKISGAAELDLSRPGYESVRKQASQTNDFTAFPSNGSLDQNALNSFRSLYDKQLKEATAVDSFGGDVMSDTALGLDTPTVAP